MKKQTILLRKGMKVLGVTGLAILATARVAQSGIYPDLSVDTPSPVPALPAGFKPFNPPVTNLPLHASAPAIAEWIRCNEPGDTLALTGDNLSYFNGNAAGRDTRFVVFGHGASEVLGDGMILRLDDRQAAVKLPSVLPANQMYFMWPRNDKGYGLPVAINQTEAWWAGPDRVIRGGTFSIFGRNLQLGGQSCHLYIEELDRWLESTSTNPYKADFVLPSNVANGTYTVWAHNGHGQHYGWSKPLQLEVENAVVWNGPTINVADYGAKGDGQTDDFAAIKDALDDARGMDFPTVYFPEGTYLVSGSLHKAKYDMRLMGAGMDKTVITTHPDYGNNPNYTYGLFYSSSMEGPVEFRDMTLSSGSVMSNSVLGPVLIRALSGANSTFENVRFTQIDHPNHADHSPIVDFGGSSYITFRNCEFVLAGAVDVNSFARQITFEDCTFKGINDVDFMLNIGSASECRITGCLVQNYDNSDPDDGHGWAQGRFVYGSGSDGSVHDIYYGDNTTVDLTVRETYTANQNTGEQYMTEFGRTRFRDAVLSATATTVSFADISLELTGKVATIVGGKGLGQHREVIDTDTGSNTVTLDAPWNVVPDSGSIIMIGNYPNRHAVYDNSFDGVDRAVVTSIPSTSGVMTYGAQHDMVVDGNTFHQLKHAITVWSMPNPEDDDVTFWLRPNYFNLFRNNTIERCRRGIGTNVAIWRSAPKEWDIALLGNVFRNNTLNDISEYAFRARTWMDDYSIDLSVYDQNVASNFETCVADDKGQRNQIWVGNRLTSSNGGDGLVVSSDHIPGLCNNSWSGFSSKYDGDLPGAVLEIPLRVVTLDSENLNGSIPVRNAGTSGLGWNASTTSDWITLSKTSGSVADENSEDTLSFTIEPDMVPDGEAEAVVSIVGTGGQEQQLTVLYSSEAALPPPPTEPPAPVLTAIAIFGPASVDEGATAQYFCQATYSDGTSAAVTPSWSENSGSTSISGSGLLTVGDVIADKTRTITATFEGMTDTFDVFLRNVPVVLTGITISGASQLNEETTAQYICTATYSDGTSAAVTPSWSENSSYASISSSGLLSAGSVSSDKSLTVSASFGGQSDTHSVTIRYVAPVITGITVSGASQLNEETTAQYFCTATYSDGTSAAVTPSWSENSSYASISSSGLLSAGNVSSDKSLTISASFGGKSDTHSVTIKYVAPVITGITISGASQLHEETTAQYTCTATYSDGTSAAVTPSWSENSSYASISSSGLLSAGDVSSDKSLTVSASFDGKSDTHAVTIRFVAPPVELTGISISGPASIEENSTAQFTCTATYSDGTSAAVTPSWSENSSKTTIGSSGLLAAGNITAGINVTVSAAYDGETASKVLSVVVVGDQVVLPLSGFSGKTVSAELWDQTAQEWISLGEDFEPEELVIEDVTPNQWYWLGLSEYDEDAGEWVLAHGRWIMR